MSSTNGQPPLTRRQVRDLERAREAGEAITGSISVVSGSPVPSAMPVTSPSPASAPAASASSPQPASAPEPGRARTRRELRAQRAADAPADPGPVPLKAPQPEHERKLSDALSHVADIEKGSGAPAASPTPASAPPSGGLPAPVSVPRASAGSPTAGSASSAPAVSGTATSAPAGSGTDSSRVASQDLGSDGRQPGPRRHGATGSGVPTPPSSVPTVFPFALSGTEGTAPGQRLASPSAPVVEQAPFTPPRATPSPQPAAASASTAATAAPPAVTPRVGGAPASDAAPASDRATPSIPASVPEPTAYVPPTGHWSTQADVDDDDTIDSVGSHFGTMTGQQNALILNDDTLPDVTGALNATGEVIITGSIDLPRSLAATGSHHAQRIDGADIDRMLEEGDREAGDSDSSPVRASRAVSANTSTRAVVLAAGKPKSNRAPIIAGICASIVVVGIVVLVIAGFVNGIL